MGSTSTRIVTMLRVVAGAATVVVAVLVGVVSWQDSGAFALVLAGVPILAAAPSLVLTLRHRRAGIATWAGAVVVIAWALVTALGTGIYLIAPGLLLLVAAVATSTERVLAYEAASAPTRGSASRPAARRS